MPPQSTEPSSRDLADYPRPSVAVDTALFTVENGELCIVLVDGPQGRSRLPGTFLHEGETLVDAVRRSLQSKAGITGGEPQQLQVFDAPDRDDRGWVLTMAHAMALPLSEVPRERIVPIDRADPLDFDHGRILSVAVERIRGDYATQPDPWGLMPPTFTLRELLHLHSAVDPSTPQRDTFRRMMEPLLVPTGELTSGTVGKPSRLFRKTTRDEVRERRARLELATLGGTRRTSRSRLEEVPIDRRVTLSTRERAVDAWLPESDLPAPARYVIRLDRATAGVVARSFDDQHAAQWAFRAISSTFERAENRVGADESLTAITLTAPDGSELGRTTFA